MKVTPEFVQVLLWSLWQIYNSKDINAVGSNSAYVQGLIAGSRLNELLGYDEQERICLLMRNASKHAYNRLSEIK